MYVPVKVELENIFSFKDATFEFNKGSNVVFGENLSDKGQESNGSGKSSLVDAIYLALVGETLRKIPKAKIIRFGQKNARTKIELKNEMLKRTLIIERIFNKTRQNTYKIEGQNLPQSKIDDISSWDLSVNFVLDELGLKKDQISNYFILKRDFIPFSLLPDAKKKDIILESIGGDFDYKTKIDEKARYKREEIDSEEAELNQYKGKLQLLEEDLEVAEQFDLRKKKTLYKQEIDLEIKNIQYTVHSLEKENEALRKEIVKKEEEFEDAKLIDFDKEIEESETKVKGCKKRIENVNEDIEKSLTWRKEDVEKIEKKSEQLRRLSLKNKEELKDLESDLYEVEKIIQHSIECPKCTHSFSLVNKKVDVDEAKLIKKDLDLEIEKKLKKSAEISAKRDEVEKEHDDIRRERDERYNSFFKLKQKYSEELNHAKSKLTQLKREKDSTEHLALKLQSYIEECKSDIERGESKIEKLKENITKLNEQKENLSVVAPDIREIRRKIKSTKNSIKEKFAILKKLEEEEQKILSWRDKFKKFHTYLSNKSLEFIEMISNEHLAGMDSELQIKLNRFKEKADGTLSDKIEVKVKRGELEESYNSFSSGESARVDISNLMAIQSLINSNSEQGGLGLLIADEAFSSLDSLGLTLVAESLKTANVPIIFISHNPFKINARVAIVKKEKGVSEIIQ